MDPAGRQQPARGPARRPGRGRARRSRRSSCWPPPRPCWSPGPRWTGCAWPLPGRRPRAGRSVLLPLAWTWPTRRAGGPARRRRGRRGAARAARPGRAVPMAAAGAPLRLLAAAWSPAGQTSTLVVLPLVALARRPRAPAAAARRARRPGRAARDRHVGALGAAPGLSRRPGRRAAGAAAGALLAAALLAAAAPAPRSRRRRRRRSRCRARRRGPRLAVLDAGRAGPGRARGGAAQGPPPWLAPAGGLLLAASSWVRLAEAGVSPRAVRPAARRGRARPRAPAPAGRPDTSSFAAYGPGLSALLLPSLWPACAGGPLPARCSPALSVLVVLLVGARGRLQAPLLSAARSWPSTRCACSGRTPRLCPAGWCSPWRAGAAGRRRDVRAAAARPGRLRYAVRRAPRLKPAGS